jgi:triosephosphate isomerase (TIM)
MRKKIVAGNWKMNMTKDEGYALVHGIIDGLPADANAEVILAPPYLFLAPVAKMLKADGPIYLAAQNCHHQKDGAYTGEVSAELLSSFGVTHVILGHSERRQYFGEDDTLIATKIEQALANGMKPIYCFGETLEQRDANQHLNVVTNQLNEALKTYPTEKLDNLVIAYEPVWAIGTGRTATPEQAQEIHAHVRKLMTEKFGQAGPNVRILYGGSCKPSNASELFSQPDIDGGLIGGASLKATDFLGIIEAC